MIELVCLAIVATYVAVRLRRAARPASVAARLALLAVAGWIGEESVIRAYGFYGYAPAWTVFVDRVPLLIALIWPVVIDSAALLADRLVGGTARARLVPLVAGAFVLADASLIEPIAVKTGLWSWTAPGPFDVPIVGVVGWPFFAVAAVATCARFGGARGAVDGATPLVVVLAPLATHAALVVSWWGLFKWITVAATDPFARDGLAAAAAWAIAIPAAVVFWKQQWRARVPFVEMAVRAPGAAFFFALLALHGAGAPVLVVFALAFAPPYLALVAWPQPQRSVPAAGPAHAADFRRSPD